MKIEDVIKHLQTEIKDSIAHAEDADACHWGGKEGILITRRQAQMIVDAITRPYEIMPHDHKLNGTIVEDEIMGQAGVPLPEWHLDPMTLPATKMDVVNIEAALARVELRLQTIERHIL
jgi:hypothetical protein